MQYYIEEYQFKSHPPHNTWEYKHGFRYEELVGIGGRLLVIAQSMFYVC